MVEGGKVGETSLRPEASIQDSLKVVAPKAGGRVPRGRGLPFLPPPFPSSSLHSRSVRMLSVKDPEVAEDKRRVHSRGAPVI